MVAIEIQSPSQIAGAGARASRDFVSILEAAYDLSASDGPWLQGLLRTVEPILGRGLGVYGFVYSLAPGGARLKVTLPTFLNCDDGYCAVLTEGTDLVRPDELARIVQGYPCQSLSQCHSRSPHGYRGFRAASYIAARSSTRDLLIVRAADTDRSGCALVAPVNRELRFPARTAGVMARISRHIAAARRLRRHVRRSALGGAVFDAEAILEQTGRVLHAEGEARGSRERVVLSAAARALAGNWERWRESHSERVVRLWTALLDGRWSLVGTMDSDGRRLLLARQNRPELKDPRALLPKERYVAALVALGHPNKLIAYELDISPSAVSTIVRSALRKLGVRSRMELVQLFQQTGSRPRAGRETRN